ncbi:ABC transporter ATP-binding protein [Paenibacillaceae bacterium]|nr:ABC transporter ATP-binding protein [Paenibacillaceae bacterium]
MSQAATQRNEHEHNADPVKQGAAEAVKLTGVGLRYPDGAKQREVLRDINLHIAEGEFVCVLGASGSGKTSLLRMIAGYEQPAAGEISIFGQRHTGPNQRVGVVFQHANLFPWLNVRSNVEFGLKMQGISKETRREKAAYYIEQVGLSNAVKLLPHQLSGGMKQRVAIARTLVTDPNLILMDEPFAALDAITREALQSQVRELWLQTGKTAFFITHDVDEALFLAGRIIVMGGSPGSITTDLPNPLQHRIGGLSEIRSGKEYAMLREQLIQLLK